MLSRHRPLKTDEALDRIVEAIENLQVLGRLGDAEAQRSSEAVDTLKTTQPSGKTIRYREFLYDVLFNSSPQYVLLCAVALGQVQVIDMKNSDRIGLIRKIKANIDITHSTIGSLTTNYLIPGSVSGMSLVRCRQEDMG